MTDERRGGIDTVWGGRHELWGGQPEHFDGWLEAEVDGRTYRILMHGGGRLAPSRVARLVDAGDPVLLVFEVPQRREGPWTTRSEPPLQAFVAAASREPDGSYREVLLHELFPLAKLHPALGSGPAIRFNWTPAAEA